MEQVQNVLSEFETEIKVDKPIQWFSIIMNGAMSLFHFYMGYKYYKMFEINNNPERIKTACMYFSTAGFMLMSCVMLTIIRYNFIRKSDLNKYINNGTSKTD